MKSLRRNFLKQVGYTAGALGLGSWLGALPAVSARQLRFNPERVRFQSGIEPMVRLIETTPRQELIEVMAKRIQAGASYQEVLAALLLAGVRNVQPRPAVGFKFHSVLVVNSAHLASQASPGSERWLPILWALDYFKSTQLEEEQTSGWKMAAVDEANVPNAINARKAFVHAMDNWDPEAADCAIAGLVRAAGKNELFELFCRYGARDYRSIGHKAIYVANSFRTLECIGWHHAEPVLRSLTFALQNHEGEPNPSKNDLPADQAWRDNQKLVDGISDAWQVGKPDMNATYDLVTTLRQADSNEAARSSIDVLGNSVSPRSIWDAVFLSAGELLMQQPGIIGLHGLTTANALHYAYQTSGDQQTRKLLLLQACSFLPMFRQSARGRGGLKEITLPKLIEDSAGYSKTDSQAEAVAEIFQQVSADRYRAASSLLGYLETGGGPKDVIDTARRLVFAKGRDAHDYKFSSAVLEDFEHLSVECKKPFLAMSVFNLKGALDSDNRLVERVQSALKIGS